MVCPSSFSTHDATKNVRSETVRTHLMRHLMIALGVSICSVAALDAAAENPNQDSRSSYQAPAQWNNFRRPNTPIPSAKASTEAMPFGATVRPVANYNQLENLPAPSAVPAMPPAPRPVAPAPEPAVQAPVASPAPVSGDPVASSETYQSPYQAATSAPWEGSECGSCNSCNTCQTCAPGPAPIRRWFGGANLLFWDIADSNDNALVTYDNGVTVLQNSDIDPSNSVGFDVHVGRYIACGQYAIGVGYMLWDPECVCRQVPDGGAGLRYINPALNTVSINRGGGATTVYDDYDTNATGIQVIRDMRIQSLEVNLSCFGLMGARRLGSCNPSPICGSGCGLFCGKGGCCGNNCDGGCCQRRLCGGAAGPLARACGGRLRIQNSHGFRWFQLEDELEIAGNVDGTSGYGPSDLYYKSLTENNLFGYQFGSRLTYCLGCRTMLNLGGKIGIYGNDSNFCHSITTTSVVAYTNSQGAGAGDVWIDESDVSLAGLGELDLGLGYRLSSCWTIHGGYRLLAACGVATAVGSMPTEYTTVASAGAVRADDCLMLHGAYIGFDYNW